MIISELYKYFSQFVPLDVLKRGFMRPSGDGYKAAAKEVIGIPSEHRDGRITDYIFGINEETVIRRISAVTGAFLFVEYSRIDSRINEKVDRKDDSFHVAITVARPRSNDQDQLTEMLWQDECLQIIADIRKTIRDDWSALEYAGVLEVSFPNSLQPFNAPNLNNAMGWTMDCDFKGVDLA